MIRWLLLGLFFLNTSCTNWLIRQGCNKINWFQQGYNVAMQGKRLQEDERYMECKKAETDINDAEVDKGFKAGMEKYCKPDTAYEKGAAGELALNYDFCDSNLGPRMKTRYMEGLKRFCEPNTGYTFGSTGGVYKNQCPKDLEEAYLARYRKGRQIYLKNQIASNKTAIQSMDGEIRELQSQRYETSSRLAALPQTKVVSKTKQYDTTTKTYKENTAVTEDPQITRQREELTRSLDRISNEVKNKQSEQQRLQKQIHAYQSEMESLN